MYNIINIYLFRRLIMQETSLRKQFQDVRVTIRVNRDLKENAEALFEYLGLNMSNAINVFLRKAVDQKGIPFPINIAEQDIKELNANNITELFKTAVNQDIEKKVKKGLPVARYDKKKRKAYLENADGSRDYV